MTFFWRILKDVIAPDTTTLSTSCLLLFLLSFLLSPRLSFPHLHPLTFTGPVFILLLFFHIKREKHELQGQLRYLLQRVCDETDRVGEFPHPRVNMTITALMNTDIHTNRTKAMSGSLSSSAPWATRGQKVITKLWWSPCSVSGTTSATIPPPTW